MSQNRRTCIVTHTGCDMIPIEAKRLGIPLVADILIFDGKEFLNAYEITSSVFYHTLRTVQKLPTSSHPNHAMFLSAFEQARGYDEILCLTVTSKMSGTYSTAAAAARMALEQGFPTPIYVFDTKQVSHGMGLMVQAALRMAGEGKGAREIMDALDAMQQNIGVYFILETLKYAYKGGRTGAIGLLATDVLGVRPLLTFKDGTVRDIALLRNAHEGLKAVAELYKKEGVKGGEVIVFHGDDLRRAQTLCRMIKQIDPDAKLRTEFVGPVIGLYAGPGSAGIAFVKEAQLL